MHYDDVAGNEIGRYRSPHHSLPPKRIFTMCQMRRGEQYLPGP